MNKQCSRCEKTVYPLEELKCLDKIWHKQCFKCQECNMSLSMRNYKGFNKQPFCEAHVPKAKATTVADTPEFKRIQEISKIQSNVSYHAEFEKAKGKFTQVADDPETLRIAQNSKNISNVQYHGDYERKAQMEQKRSLVNENGTGKGSSGYGSGSHSPDEETSESPILSPSKGLVEQDNLVLHMANSSSRYSTPPSQPIQPSQPTLQSYSKAQGSTPYSARTTESSTVIFTSDMGPVSAPPGRRVGSIADYDPLNEYYGSLCEGAGGSVGHGTPQRPPQGRTFRAVYDYEAQDNDEVSFLDGDVLVGCIPIDEGWMTGTVQRTGQRGMLPANYVESYN